MKKIALFIVAITTLAPINAAKQKHTKSGQRAQCGTIEHLSSFAPLISARDTISSDEKKAFGLQALKVLSALIRLNININKHEDARFTLKNPAVKEFCKEMRKALECSHFKSWLNHIRKTVKTHDFDKINSVYTELVALAQDALIMDKTTDEQMVQCGHLDHLSAYVPLFLEPSELTEEEIEAYTLQALKIVRAIVNFGIALIESGKAAPSWEGPAVKELIKELEATASCSNLTGWMEHISSTFKAYDGKQLKELIRELSALVQEAFIMNDSAPEEQEIS